MDIVIIVLEVVLIVLLLLVVAKIGQKGSAGKDNSDEIKKEMRDIFEQTERRIKLDTSESIKNFGANFSEMQNIISDKQFQKLNDIDSQLNQKIGELKNQMEKDISGIKNDTAEKLGTIQKTVDSKLQTTLDEKMTSFGQMVSLNQKQASDAQDKHIAEMTSKIDQNLSNMNKSIAEKQEQSANNLNDSLKNLENRFKTLESGNEQKLENIQKTVDDKLQTTLDEKMTSFAQMVSLNQKQASDAQDKHIAEMTSKIDQNLSNMNKSIAEKQQQSANNLNDSLKNLENRFKTLESSNEQKLENMRSTMSRQLSEIQAENQKKLDTIQGTVNEKLETQLQKSFKIVSEQLETVHTSLGEMRNIATGVGDLKKVLSNVKTRGILGEIQLGSILEEILAPEQYEREISTIKGSKDHVEFAVKLPGNKDGEVIYLPIDSKFPGDTYEQLLDAYDTGDKAVIDTAKKNLRTRIRGCAKDIKEKYVAPPYTTNFGIMFLPFEGLYAEVVNLGLIEELQRDYSVSITGPSTMAAMLNTLQMGFRTLAIQKKSNEVWEVLSAVKKEFTTFNDVLSKAQKQIQTAGESIDKLIGTRTRAINRKLSTVEMLDDADKTREILGIDVSENSEN